MRLPTTCLGGVLVADPRLLAEELQAVFVTLPDGSRALAERRRDLPFERLFECREVAPPRFYRVTQGVGDDWPVVFDVSDVVVPWLANSLANMQRTMAGMRAGKALAVRAADGAQPSDWQERIEPTEAVEVTISRSTRRVREICRRRVVEARLWDAMSGDQQGAAERIAGGFEVITAGLGASGMRLGVRGDRSYGDPWEGARGLIEDYWAWAKRTQRQELSVAAALDVLAFGLSCREVDRRRRKRKGWARGNLFEALEVYCDVKGWSGRRKSA